MTTDADQADRNAMSRLAAGDDSALDELMGRHGEKLFHYLLRFLQNEAEPSDLAEEALVRVYQNRARYNPRHKFSTWLYTIATNLARDVQRFRTRHPHVSLDREGEDGSDFHELLSEPKPNPGEALESEERVGAIRSAIAALPEDLRAPLLLATFEEQSYAEIAEILNCSVKAVEMRLYRARQELRGKLEKVLAAIS
jgi:RNA polymerase sigma-70 factor (ECF subfamily)